MSDIQAKIKHNLTSAESSDEEEEVNLSPLKRRRNRKIPLDLDEINLALDFKGFLDVQTFFSDNFKWFEGAEEIILNFTLMLMRQKVPMNQFYTKKTSLNTTWIFQHLN